MSPENPDLLQHYEYCRVSNPTRGEYYVIPIETLQKKVVRHLSYHQSGVFHWREEDGSSAKPFEGEADQRRAALRVQAIQHLNWQLHGYCIARGSPSSTMHDPA